jgi:hypothetical protein
LDERGNLPDFFGANNFPSPGVTRALESV